MLDLDCGFAELRAFLQEPHDGVRVLTCARNETLYRQGDEADALYYIHSGSVMVSTVSQRGKSAVVSVRGKGHFIGQGVLIGVPQRDYTVSMLSDCMLTRIERAALHRLMETHPAFTKWLLLDTVIKLYGAHENVVDQIVNTSDVRLARLLLRLAESSDPAQEPAPIPQVSQEKLAEMVGTTRGRINVFLNRFRREGLIENETPIRVYRTRLSRLLEKS